MNRESLINSFRTSFDNHFLSKGYFDQSFIDKIFESRITKQQISSQITLSSFSIKDIQTLFIFISYDYKKLYIGDQGVVIKSMDFDVDKHYKSIVSSGLMENLKVINDWALETYDNLNNLTKDMVTHKINKSFNIRDIEMSLINALGKDLYEKDIRNYFIKIAGNPTECNRVLALAIGNIININNISWKFYTFLESSNRILTFDDFESSGIYDSINNLNAQIVDV
jgi:hypothetical protein